MEWRRMIRVLLEPAKDPLRDSFGISVERVRELRIRLNAQLAELKARAVSLRDPALETQIRTLQAEHDRLADVEHRVNGELDAHHARRHLIDARETAGMAQERLQDLLAALDDAQARATALAEAAWEPGLKPSEHPGKRKA